MEREEGVWTDHYVVVKHIGAKRVELWDPDPLEKKKRVPYDEFFKYWMGYALFLEPDECFKTGTKKENLQNVPYKIDTTIRMQFTLWTEEKGIETQRRDTKKNGKRQNSCT
jgi:ABC-type bacteriocin/lantibiotic exporter with double-glycine peptidase domain